MKLLKIVRNSICILQSISPRQFLFYHLKDLFQVFLFSQCTPVKKVLKFAKKLKIFSNKANLERVLFIFCALVVFTETGFCTCSSTDRFDGRKLILTEKQWKEKLAPEQFDILRKGKTELPFKNAYFDNKKPGIYLCAGCSLPLFSSEGKV